MMEKKWRELKKSITPRAGGPQPVTPREEGRAPFPTLFTAAGPQALQVPRAVLLHAASVVEARGEDILSASGSWLPN